MYLQSPRTNSSRHHCQTDLFPQVHFFIREGEKVARLTRHTGLNATQDYLPTQLSFFVLFCSSFLFFFPEKVKILHYLTCHTGVIATQDYFHTGLFFFSQVYLPHGTIVCIVATQVYYILIRRYQGKILHASSATQDYLQHRLSHAVDKGNL